MHLSVVVFIFPAFFAGLPTVALYTCRLHTSLCTLPSHHLGKVWYGMVGVSISAAFFFWLGKARMIEKSILGPWP